MATPSFGQHRCDRLLGPHGEFASSVCFTELNPVRYGVEHLAAEANRRVTRADAFARRLDRCRPADRATYHQNVIVSSAAIS